MLVGPVVWLLLARIGPITPVAASPPSAPDSAIVVQGTRDRDKQINDFIRELTPTIPGPQGQLSRFEEKVCPQVFGLPAAYDQLVAERMRAVAAAAGIPVGKEGCRANVVVIVTADKADFIKRASVKRSYIFPRAWSGSTIRALQRDRSPAVAWTVEEKYSADGIEFDYGNEVPLNRSIGSLSRLKPTARPRTLASVLVIQTDALDGLSTRQLADYAAMRTFVNTEPRRVEASARNTILTLLDTPMGQPVPLSLTAWDLSFLKSFYASRLNSYAGYQRAEMKGIMRRELDLQQSSR